MEISNLSSEVQAILGSVSSIATEVVLGLGIILIILLDLIRYGKEKKGLNLLALSLLGLNLAYLAISIPVEGQTFLGVLNTITKEKAFLILIDLIGVFYVVFQLVLGKPDIQKKNNKLSGEGETLALIFSIILGLHVLIKANNLLLLFIGLELISLPSYILTAFRFRKVSGEGAIKYLLLGVISTAIMLYGMSWMYGIAGSLNFSEVTTALLQQPVEISTIVFVFFLAGLLFKLSVFPMYFWAPDMYESAPIGTAAFLSIAPKIAALLALKHFVDGFGVALFEHPIIPNILIGIAILTMFIGNVSALGQEGSRRMMAYSTIGQMGLLMLVLFLDASLNYQTMLFYMTAYAFANLVIFMGVGILEQRKDSDRIASFAGEGKGNLALGIAMTIAFISLVGLPPFAGFSAKLFVFTGVWSAYEQFQNDWLFYALIAALINTVISLYFYLKIPYQLFIKELSDEGFSLLKREKSFLILFALPLIVLFILPQILI
ncbi:NADH-quinone oxidoreductase subunit N [Sediminitomix flava]|uniref:NADH-quinone oxidoreductase subunit N n=1 Tax=Sediminitomix flava TaxID=379075 RepID=A0A315Z6P7_SEDFL|nr:NADH-quinone oxidoreductase subunit N [Sediminitomix flava]PWJ40043.1 NADH dehydrogenase subunit N [Sediminitomix flava]